MSDSPGLAYWADAVLNRDGIEDVAYQRLVGHPLFATAAREAARAAVERHTGNPAVSRTVKNIRRLFYGIFALYLDARGGLSLTTIRELCVELGIASPGLAAAILLRLRMLGFVVVATDTADKRTRKYVASPAMKAAFADMFRRELVAFSIIEPQARDAADAIGDPDVFRHFALNGGRGLPRAIKSTTPTPITPFALRDAGIAILHEIALSGADDDTYPPAGPVQMAVAPLARKFGVSRSHVLRLLREVERNGHLRRNADELTGTLEEPLREDLRRFHASGFLMTVASAHPAMLAAQYGAKAAVSS